MSIVSGYKKCKKYILTSSGFQLVSHWTKANTLEFDDGKTAQAKLGAIDGISSSRESNSDKIAASTALVSELNSDLASLNDAGAIQGMDAREDGIYITYIPVVGADAVTKKLGNSPIVIPVLKMSGQGNNGGSIQISIDGQNTLSIGTLAYQDNPVRILKNNTVIASYTSSANNIKLNIAGATSIGIEASGWADPGYTGVTFYNIVIA